MDNKDQTAANGGTNPQDTNKAGATGEQYKSYVQQSVDEQRYMVPTKNGVIDEVIVQKYKEAHQQAVKE